VEFYRKSNGAIKKEIPGCIFAEKLALRHRAQGAELSVSETFSNFQTARPHDRKTKSVSVRVWKKIESVRSNYLALTLTLALFLYPNGQKLQPVEESV
jgi:hypothetical protein